MQSINNHIIRTECHIDMNQMALERDLQKLSLLMPKKNNFALHPVLPSFAMPPNKCALHNSNEAKWKEGPLKISL